MRAPGISIESASDIMGASRWCSQPIVLFVLHVPQGLPAESIEPAFARFPAAAAPRGAQGEAAAVRIARVAHTLARACGLPVLADAAVERGEGDTWRVAIPTVTGMQFDTRRLVAAVIEVANVALRGEDSPRQDERLRKVLTEVAAAAPQRKNTVPMLQAAQRAGIPWERVIGSVFRLGQGARARWFDSSATDRTSLLSTQLARNKHETAAVLRQQNIPVPRHLLARSADEAVAAAAKIGYPVVVKPADMDRGLGVAARLRDEAGVRRAWEAAAKLSNSVLVEQHFFGEDHRIHVFEGEVFRVRHRVPGGVTGDGKATVAQLLEALNADPRRGPSRRNPELIRIDMDDEAVEMLSEDGMTPASVPADGQFVQLRRIANVSVGGVSHHVAIEDAHPDNLLLAARAVAALKLDLAAVDFLIPDIRKSWLEVGAAICEINAMPQFGDGAPEWLFARIFPHQGRVPVVAVVAPAGAPDWVAQVRERVRGAGVALGYCDASGTWLGDRQISAALPQGVFQGCGILFGESTVQAVLLVADASFAQHGLPADRFDAVIVDGEPTPAMDHLAAALGRHTQRLVRAAPSDRFVAKLAGLLAGRRPRTAQAKAP